MKKLHHVNFIFVHEYEDEDSEGPTEADLMDRTREYWRLDNIPIPEVEQLPDGFHKNYIPYGSDNETIYEILYGDKDIIVIDGVKYQRVD